MDIFGSFLNSFSRATSGDLKKKDEEEQKPPVTDKLKEIPPNREVLLSWDAPTRVFTPRDPQYYKRVLSIVFVVALLLVIAGQFLLLGLIVSVVVLLYVLSSVPPERVKHEIDNYGVYYLGKEYYWGDLKFFFFTRDGGYDVLNVDTKEPYPGRLFLVLEGISIDKVKEVLSKQLPFRQEPPHTVFDKAFKNISSKLSLE